MSGPTSQRVILVLLNVHRDLQAGAKLVLNRRFADEHWTKNRVVTCLDWSPQVCGLASGAEVDLLLDRTPV